jgi:hypothetical protein
MEIRLLPASADSTIPSGTIPVSASVGSISQVAITTRLRTSDSVHDADGTYVWSSTSGNDAYHSYTSPQRGLQSNDSSSNADADWGYYSSSSWSATNALSPAAQYLTYAAISTTEAGQLVDVYA